MPCGLRRIKGMSISPTLSIRVWLLYLYLEIFRNARVLLGWLQDNTQLIRQSEELYAQLRRYQAESADLTAELNRLRAQLSDMELRMAAAAGPHSEQVCQIVIIGVLDYSHPLHFTPYTISPSHFDHFTICCNFSLLVQLYLCHCQLFLPHAVVSLRRHFANFVRVINVTIIIIINIIIRNPSKRLYKETQNMCGPDW